MPFRGMCQIRKTSSTISSMFSTWKAEGAEGFKVLQSLRSNQLPGMHQRFWFPGRTMWKHQMALGTCDLPSPSKQPFNWHQCLVGVSICACFERHNAQYPKYQCFLRCAKSLSPQGELRGSGDGSCTQREQWCVVSEPHSAVGQRRPRAFGRSFAESPGDAWLHCRQMPSSKGFDLEHHRSTKCSLSGWRILDIKQMFVASRELQVSKLGDCFDCRFDCFASECS